MRTVTKVALAFAVLLVTPGAPGLRADEGSIPIFKQTIITAPGHYVVTRDFSIVSGNGVSIMANNVNLDLNGHTITGPSPGSGQSGVFVDTAFATGGIVIRNGRLLSMSNGIFSTATNRVSIRIERVETGNNNNSGIIINAAESVEILNCHVHDVVRFSGINVQGSTGAFQGSVSDNSVEHIAQSGIALTGMVAGEVRGNVVTDYGLVSVGSSGILLGAGALAWGAGGNLVEDNTVTALPGGTDDDGIVASGTSPYNLILNNVVKGCRNGIVSGLDGTRIERNVVSNNSGDGILVSGSTNSFNHLEENQVQANTGAGGCGIRFNNGNGHVFRNNNLRNNTTGVCGGALGTNSDGGGNIL